HSRLGHPRSITAAVPITPRRLDLRDRASRGALVGPEPHRDQPLMHLVGTDLALRPINELLDFRQERIDQPRPATRRERVTANIPHPDIPSDGLRITADQ